MIQDGQIVLFAFPHTNQSVGKLRPALILRALPGPQDDWLFILPNSRIIVISYVAGFRPGSRGPFVSAKGPKTIDAPFGLMTGDGRKTRRAGQLARLTQGPPDYKSVHQEGRPAGVGQSR